MFAHASLYAENPKSGTSANSVAFHQGLHCLLRLKQPSGTEAHYNLENSYYDPLKHPLGRHILIVSTCMGKFIILQSVNIV